MTPKVRTMVGWVLSALIGGFLLFSASGKLLPLMPADKKAELFGALGWQEETMKVVGVIEVVIVALYLIPRTGFVGSILLTAYLGGATAAHVRIGDPWYFSVVLGVLAWVGYGLRNPVIFKLALGAKPTP